MATTFRMGIGPPTSSGLNDFRVSVPNARSTDLSVKPQIPPRNAIKMALGFVRVSCAAAFVPPASRASEQLAELRGASLTTVECRRAKQSRRQSAIAAAAQLERDKSDCIAATFRLSLHLAGSVEPASIRARAVRKEESTTGPTGVSLDHDG